MTYFEGLPTTFVVTPQGKKEVIDLPSLPTKLSWERLPATVKILVENVARHLDGAKVGERDLEAILGWMPEAQVQAEFAFSPDRVLMQDFTGVPAVVDLAALREAVRDLGGKPEAVNPRVQVDLVIDHSVIVDHYATPDAFDKNVELEYQRNGERYRLLKWAQASLRNFRVVPPGTGICHQVNLEYLAQVVREDEGGRPFFDTLVGTDSHTTMVNGLGVLGWGVGGIEAEAAMLGHPISMLVPEVVGMRLVGELRPGVTATDLVLTITEMLRREGVVGKFVEFFGEGLPALSVETRATIGNMSPEYGATCAFFPIDERTLEYLALTGRSEDVVARVEAYTKAQGLFHSPAQWGASYSKVLTLDLATVEPSMAGPSRPQDRLALGQVKEAVESRVRLAGGPREVEVALDGTRCTLADGHVVIAAITSCTNTSNPDVMIAAGLVARKAVALGLKSKPWVKTSLAPGSRVVVDYLREAGLLDDLEALGFYLVGFGCTTCIGNSGPLLEPISRAIAEKGLSVAAVLSGNRNFEARIHPEVRMNFLASPPLVVASALAGTVLIDFENEPIASMSDGPVFLKDIWPRPEEIRQARSVVSKDLFEKRYAEVFVGDRRWQAIEVGSSLFYPWQEDSTYVRKPAFLEKVDERPPELEDIRGARVLAYLGDSVTTDHISPAGSIRPDSPAGQYLISQGVAPADFNSYGARRGNHEVMVRGTFANVRLRNKLVSREGGFTRFFPTGEELPIYEAARRYAEMGVPLVVLAGKEYGSGSSRDWAAKGVMMLGVKAVIAESFERIHRSNLVEMGVIPLELDGTTWEELGVTGEEQVSIEGISQLNAGELIDRVTVRIGEELEISAKVRVDTELELRYLRAGGILPYVARELAGEQVAS